MNTAINIIIHLTLMCLYTAKIILNMFQNIQQINSNCILGGLLKLIKIQPDKISYCVHHLLSIKQYILNISLV